MKTRCVFMVGASNKVEVLTERRVAILIME